MRSSQFETGRRNIPTTSRNGNYSHINPEQISVCRTSFRTDSDISPPADSSPQSDSSTSEVRHTRTNPNGPLPKIGSINVSTLKTFTSESKNQLGYPPSADGIAKLHSRVQKCRETLKRQSIRLNLLESQKTKKRSTRKHGNHKKAERQTRE